MNRIQRAPSLGASPHLVCQYSALPLTTRASPCTKHMFVANKMMLPVIHIILCSCVHMLTTVFIWSILRFRREKGLSYIYAN